MKSNHHYSNNKPTHALATILSQSFTITLGEHIPVWHHESNDSDYHEYACTYFVNVFVKQGLDIRVNMVFTQCTTGA